MSTKHGCGDSPAYSIRQPRKNQLSDSGERFTTWAVILLSDMDRQQIYDEYAKGKVPMPKAYIESYMCPSDAVQTRAGTASSYIANAGWATSASNQSPMNGAFVNRAFNPLASVLEGHWKDGRDRTLAFSERKDAGGYDIMGWNGFTQAPDKNGDQIDHEVVDRQQRDRTWGNVFVWHSNPLPCSYINGPDCGCERPDAPPCVPQSGTGRFLGANCTFDCNTQERAPNARPTSEHGGGVNVAFGSGRATFLHETIDYKVYRALMTLNEKNSNSPYRDFIIDDATLQ